MTWNHRIIQTTHNDTVYYQVTEVFYEDDGSIMGWVDPDDYKNQCGETIDELRHGIEYMLQAFDAPVLEAIQPDGTDVPTLVEITT